MGERLRGPMAVDNQVLDRERGMRSFVDMALVRRGIASLLLIIICCGKTSGIVVDRKRRECVASMCHVVVVGHNGMWHYQAQQYLY